MKKIKLKTDFVDYYDHWFDNEGKVFERMSENNLSRSEMFKILEQNYIPTIKNGAVKDLATELKPDSYVVVYLNEYKHQGNGKILCSLDEASKKYPNYYASEYLKTYRSMSWRELILGEYHFDLQYSSNDLWRSNVGDVDIEIKRWEKDEELKFPLTYPMCPIYAIDYVANYFPNKKTIDFYAVDLNLSPMVRGTGIEDIVSAKELVESIKKCI